MKKADARADVEALIREIQRYLAYARRDPNATPPAANGRRGGREREMKNDTGLLVAGAGRPPWRSRQRRDGGTSQALITGAQIKDGTIASRDIKNGTIARADIAAGR